jgi:hypothetical protein
MTVRTMICLFVYLVVGLLGVCGELSNHYDSNISESYVRMCVTRAVLNVLWWRSCVGSTLEALEL